MSSKRVTGCQAELHEEREGGRGEDTHAFGGKSMFKGKEYIQTQYVFENSHNIREK